MSVVTELRQTRAKKSKGGKRKPSALHRGDGKAAALFLAPWFIGLILITAGPMVASAYLSFTDYSLLQAPNWIGLENYTRMFEDPRLLNALKVTFLYVFISVPLQLAVALALALLLDKGMKALAFYRSVYYLPSLLGGSVAIALLWRQVFGADGLVNAVLGWFGIDGPNWTSDPTWVKPGLILMSLLSVGGSVIILLAALRNVPEELYDAAKVDGAGFLRRTWSVTVPMISGSLLFVFIVNTIAALQSFTEAYTAFFGVGNSTYNNDAAEFYVIHVFRQAFEFLQMGYASALAWVLFVVIMVITAAQLYVSKRLVFYQGDQ